MIFSKTGININENITVDSDSALVFIVSGDITIGPDVTEIHGVYIADGKITIEDGDNPFSGEGSFIAWDKINLNRNLGNVLNQTTPAETFTSRPDMFLKLTEVEPLLAYKKKWREMSP